MNNQIPFISTKGDINRWKKFFYNSKKYKVSLAKYIKNKNDFLGKDGLWLDPEIDGFHHILNQKTVSVQWKEYIEQFIEHKVLNSPDFIKKPEKKKIVNFVEQVMNKLSEYNPNWITVPQLPVVDDTSRNHINRILASCSVAWKIKSGFKGKFILPLIFSHSSQIRGKTQWKPKVDTAYKTLISNNIDLIWVSLSDIDDSKGIGTNLKRMQSLIELHRYLRKKCENIEIIAGPYWGLNLVLWASQQCDYPAIKLGPSFKYTISGTPIVNKGKARIALSPFYRLSVVNPELRTWLDNSLDILSDTDLTYEKLNSIKEKFDSYLDREIAKDQVIQFYSDWIKSIEAVSISGRQISLYQKLSSAYVIGKQFKAEKNNLPRSEAPARSPERIAEHLMLVCL